MTKEEFREIFAHTLPLDPGIYQFLDEDDTILYVGKAKNLRNRVNSYFSGENSSFKTRVMIRHAKKLNFTLVDTEQDALLLENTLIKRFQPRYNIMLKDGKTYAYLCIKNEKFPRVFFTRKVIRDGSTYFGPYTSKFRMNVLLEIIHQLFQLRTCNLPLNPESIAKGKFKVCLEYHIKNCQGPCEGYESEAEYADKIQQIKNILRGNFASVKQYLKELMQEYALNLQFELAQELKLKLEIFDNYQSKSTVVSASIRDVDVFSIASDPKEAFVNYLKIVNGAIIHTFTQEYIKNLNEEESDILAFAILEMREKFNSIAEEVIAPIKLSLPEEQFVVTIPQIGDKKKLLELSEKNVHYHLLQKRKEQINRTGKQTSAERILGTLKADLQMDAMPIHIECFDNSNIQGSNPVSACVVFKNAKPLKSEYRHFNVKTVEGPNDFATMEEVVYRRYKRQLEENKPLPQLIIIDGGKGQLSAAVKSLEALEIQDKVTIIGIAKRLEEIYFPGDSLPLYINKKSESLKLIQQARDEAHRFGITFHRNQRSKKFIQTQLRDIPGVGAKIADSLLKQYKSVEIIRNLPLEDLQTFLGLKKGEIVFRYFNAALSADDLLIC
ncbi:MAG: excinuclease ABC subunit UvrC [Saprospiraceae bacterium]